MTMRKENEIGLFLVKTCLCVCINLKPVLDQKCLAHSFCVTAHNKAVGMCSISLTR